MGANLGKTMEISFDFNSQKNEILLNPRFEKATQVKLENQVKQVLTDKGLNAHFAILTSGTTTVSADSFKFVLLSKAAVLNSARAVNDHLKARPNDVWLSVLPYFHVGGLGIWARAFLSGSKVMTLGSDSWNAGEFLQKCHDSRVTLTSLVPTQLYDLVRLGEKAPGFLRAVVIGGGALDRDLYAQSRELGYPILPSYGMTETASQIVTAPLDSLMRMEFPEPVLLSHAQFAIADSGYLKVYSSSLLTSYIYIEGDTVKVESPLDKDGWLTTEDFAARSGSIFKIIGRGQDYIKVGGEAVNLAKQRQIFESLIIKHSFSDGDKLALTKRLDPRLGAKIVLYQSCDENEYIRKIVEEYNKEVLPFERIKARFRVEQIPRTELGKIMWAQLESLAGVEI